jgi:Immunity protein Imm5
MEISPELQTLLEKAQTHIRRHPEDDLPLGYRQAIKMALGPYYDIGKNNLQSPAAVGYKRRGVLAILTARYVQPIWQQVTPTEDLSQEEIDRGLPARTLLRAQKYLTGELTVGSAKEFYRFYNLIWQDVLSLMQTEDIDQTWPVGAGWAALKALLGMRADFKFEIDLSRTDESIRDIDARDYEFHAVVAYANGTPDWPNADQARRHQFWNWWLTEAIPIAWNAVQADGSFQNMDWQLPTQSDTDGQESFLYEQMTDHQETTVKNFDVTIGIIKRPLTVNETSQPS